MQQQPRELDKQQIQPIDFNQSPPFVSPKKSLLHDGKRESEGAQLANFELHDANMQEML